MTATLPVVGIVSDRRMIGDHAFHVVGEKYIDALRGGADVLPLLIPSLQPPLAPDDLLARVDGVLFTGSPSNVAPHLYDGAPPRPGTWLDEARDAIALPLLRAAIAARVPVFCICRGFQELNVAFGGTLHQQLREVAGRLDHSAGDRKRSLERQYGPAHPVRVAPGGVLEKLLPGQVQFEVNSLHSQGIDRLAEGLRVEAEAPDGTIEAVSMPGARGFLIAVQWHPEWRYAENPVSRALYAGFGAAVRRHAGKRE